MFEVGDTVDRYVVEGEIGRGGLAAVYKVRHKRLLTAHAIKVLFISRGPIAERLILEGRIQANLRHPNIVHVSDVLDVDGAPVLLMDFIDGPTMKEWLSENRPSLSQSIFLFGKILDGMAHAHAHGMIHRDLKPDNIMMAPGPKGWMPKLMDFGLAKLLDDGHSAGNTRAGATMGTPEFMSPEQVRDSADVDERADIFSLGCIFYQLLTGTSPFRADDIVGVFNAITKEDPPNPSTIVSTIPLALDSLVLHMLAKERDDRPHDCNSIIQAINEIASTLDDAPAAPPSAPDDPTGLPSRHFAQPLPSQPGATGTGLRASGGVAPSGRSALNRSIPPPWAGSLSSETDDPGSLTFFMPGEPEVEDTSEDNSGTWPPTGRSKKSEWAIGLAVVGAMLAAVFWGTSSPTDDTTSKTLSGQETELLAPSPSPPPPPQEIQAEVPEAEAVVETNKTVKKPTLKKPAVKSNKTAPKAIESQQTKRSTKTPPQPPAAASPTKESAAPVSASSKVTLTGDAQTVWLTNDAGMFPIPGDVPQGQYQIKAWFSSAKPVIAGSKTITGGQNGSVNCNSFMERCK
jgi:serine/threonine protein kinase